MNNAGDQFEWAVAYANFWDGVYRVSGMVSMLAVVFTTGYVVAAVVLAFK